MQNKLPNKKALAAGALIALFLAGLFKVGAFAGFEYFLEDTLLSPQGVSPDLVIIAIDDQSIAHIGQWPWPRAEYAKLLDTLKSAPPKVIGFDVVFSENSRVGKADDEKFAKSLVSYGAPVVLAQESDDLKPLPMFLAGKRVKTGDVHLTLDPDGVVRRAYLPGSFASTLASSSNPTPASARIAYGGKPGTVRRISFAQVVEDKELAKTLEGKIVLIGSTAIDLHDEQLTPLSGGVSMPGVEIQANIVNMLAENKNLRELSHSFDIFLIILFVLLPIIFFALFPHLLVPIIASVLSGLVALVLAAVFFDRGVVFNILYPALALFASLIASIVQRYFGSEARARTVKDLFGKYVSSEVLEEILKNPTEVKLGGEEREVSILFSDIRGFTTLSESMTPAELTTFMNKYLSLMTEIILKHNGVVDKYIGDAIMAFWGAPLSNPLHYKDALAAAVDMADALDKFNDENIKAGLPGIEIGIGINAGKVVAGNMGSRQRMSYTIMGDAVNLASRLEGITKLYGVRVIASASVLGASTPEELAEQGVITREIDKVKVKGKKEPVTIYQVIRPSRRAEIESIKGRFDLARDYYYKADWDKCLKLLAEIETIVPSDGPTRVLRERCLSFKVVEPTHWDGVYEHKTK